MPEINEKLKGTVFVIDDDGAIREALDGLFRSAGLRVEAYPSVEQFLEISVPARPSCLVLDVKLKGRSGLEFQDELVKRDAGIPIIFISGNADIPMSVRAMKAGAIEFLTKPLDPQDLLDVVQAALELDLGSHERELAGSDEMLRFSSLTKRERGIMELVVSGRLNKQIAFELGLSEVTVKVHRASVMRKMKATSLAELVRISSNISTSRPRRLT